MPSGQNKQLGNAIYASSDFNEFSGACDGSEGQHPEGFFVVGGFVFSH